MSTFGFKGEKLIGKSNYISWLPEAKLFLEINGYMPYIDESEEKPKIGLYYKKEEVIPKETSSEVSTTKKQYEWTPYSPELAVKYNEKLAEFERHSKRALGAIKTTISLEIIERFKNKTTASELWEAIENTYSYSSFEVIGRYFNRLIDNSYNSFNSIDEYTSNLQASSIYLKELSTELPKPILAWILFKGLPNTFDSFISRKYEELAKTLESKAYIDLNKLIADIISEEARIKACDLELNKTTTKFKSSQANIKYCKHCNRKGHLENQCYTKYPELRRPNNPIINSNSKKTIKNQKTSKEESNKSNKDLNKATTSSNIKQESPKVVMSTLGHSSLNRGILLDSGASEHYTPYKEWLLNYKPINYKTIVIADSKRINIEGIGDIPIIINNRELIITKVNYVPSLKATLLSPKELVNKG